MPPVGGGLVFNGEGETARIEEVGARMVMEDLEEGIEDGIENRVAHMGGAGVGMGEMNIID